MTDKRITELTTRAALLAADLIEIAGDVGGSPTANANYKATLAALQTFLGTDMPLLRPVVSGGTWATVSALTPPNGSLAWVTDIGANGSLWIYNATEARWRPINGLQSLMSTMIPMFLQSSGSIGNNGALSGLTALPNTYASCYMYFPVNTIAAGVPAGLYYVTMSSTTAGTIFNNTYTGGRPTIPASPTPFATTGPGAYTQTISTDIALLTYTVKGGVMGLEGSLIAEGIYGYNNTAGAKTQKLNLASTTITSSGPSASASTRLRAGIGNRGSAALQTFSNANLWPSLASATAMNVAAINTANDQNFTWNAQLAVATDFLFLAAGMLTLQTP